MPKRIVDGEGIWLSNKLLNMGAVDAIPILLYAWLLPIAEHNGVFEYEPKAIHKRALAYHDIMPEDELEGCLKMYRGAGLLFVWTEQTDGKEYGYWVGSDKKGRLPGEKYSKRCTWPPEPPKALLNKYIQDSVRLSETQCIGVGSGIGLGKGVGSGAEAPPPSEENMAITKDIAYLCYEILGVQDPFVTQLGNPAGDALKQAAKKYGNAAVLEAFEQWAESVRGEDINYPISKFVQKMDGLLRGIITVTEHPDLKPLGATLYEIGNQVFTNQQLAGLLKNYKRDEIEASYQEFVYSLDDYSIKFAVRDFCNGGADAIISARRKREETRQKQEKQATAEQEKLAKDAEAELARIAQNKKEAEEALKEF